MNIDSKPEWRWPWGAEGQRVETGQGHLGHRAEVYPEMRKTQIFSEIVFDSSQVLVCGGPRSKSPSRRCHNNRAFHRTYQTWTVLCCWVHKNKEAERHRLKAESCYSIWSSFEVACRRPSWIYLCSCTRISHQSDSIFHETLVLSHLIPHTLQHISRLPAWFIKWMNPWIIEITKLHSIFHPPQ